MAIPDYIALLPEPVRKDIARVDELIRANLVSSVRLIPEVGDYVLGSGGKRFRPALLSLTSRLCGHDGGRQITHGAVIEFVHTATLLHDDVIDHASLRRGNASVNTVWGNRTSVLVGDYFYSRASALLVEDGSREILKLISEVLARMVEGEILAMLRQSDASTTEEDYERVITYKTALLISCACRIGGMVADCTEEEEKALAEYGHHLGIAFQLIDDTLDYTSTEFEFGKDVGNDLKEGKLTLPLIHAIELCTPSEREVIAHILKTKNQAREDFLTVVELIDRYGGISYTREAAERHVDWAQGCLQTFSDCVEKKALLALCRYALDRRA